MLIIWFVCGLYNDIKVGKIYKQLNTESKSFGFFGYNKKLDYIQNKIYHMEDEYYQKELSKIQVCQKFFIISSVFPLILAVISKIVG
jgi:hypothetical protein